MHGYAFGLGIDIATCADIRICAVDTTFAVKEVDIGLAADVGTLSRLPKVVGNFGWVKDVALSARSFNAGEAYQVGFVSQVHDTKAKALEAGLNIAALLATKSPVAVQGTKELLNHARDHSVADSKFYEPPSEFPSRRLLLISPRFAVY
jgi:Delta3,5-Delta2,4-dienoyl-CoA isomerase